MSMNYDLLRDYGRPSTASTVAKWGIAGLATFGVFDFMRSVGQNTESTSLLDNARTVLVVDYNIWEQTKDYYAPQDLQPAETTVTKNEDKEPFFDGRSLDFGHMIIGGTVVGVSAWAKSKRK